MSMTWIRFRCLCMKSGILREFAMVTIKAFAGIFCE